MKRELTHGSLFSGIEGFGLGAALAGIKTEWSCEFENPPFVNIISGGFPISWTETDV